MALTCKKMVMYTPTTKTKQFSNLNLFLSFSSMVTNTNCFYTSMHWKDIQFQRASAQKLKIHRGKAKSEDNVRLKMEITLPVIESTSSNSPGNHFISFPERLKLFLYKINLFILYRVDVFSSCWFSIFFFFLLFLSFTV